MGRKYPPTMITASRADTELAEWEREREREARTHRPRVPARSPEPEPEAEPTRQPRPGRGRRIVVERTPANAAVLSNQDAADLKLALMFQEAHSSGVERETAIRARRAVGRATEGESR